ncbi:glycoside hydrolase family 3 protein [Fulvivirga sp. M361]|uniref:glycoside hydrolase family 3 C-terminal domain-containing protein n=1 Tax=Fulvivirga sp. M361 TaxID=2594266 RepID=UPI00117A24D8|nr:glycoside hydrolase family 3 C-terminal domain-containing protein [Fulvivirga sp. M361]TRX59971.1 glycoside hydrolase family 3 protein [Fulvivirga sp. M361]
MRLNKTSLLFSCLFIFSFIQQGFAQVDHAWYNSDLPFEERADLLVAQMTLEEKVSQVVHQAPAIPRLGIPEYNWWNEALHGVARNGKATIFPQSIALAATFDPELAYEVASAISDEARAKYSVSQAMGNRGQYAGLTFWTPNVNIFRDPRWGRGQETYGEDPYLTSRIGVAFAKGLQGNHPKYLKTAACAKHFAVHSGPEALRHNFDVHPTEKDLNETYLPAFEALVKEAKVEGIMGAYNAVYGEPSCGNGTLLKDILKDTWGFNGYIVSDCGALGDFNNGHNITGTIEESAAMALNTGVNLNCGYAYQNLKKAIELNLTSEDILDRRLKELMMTRFKLGFFDPVEQNPYTQLGPEQIHSEEHIQLSRRVARNSMVLLKNKDNVLPLDKNIRVPYVTGPFASSGDILLANYYGVSNNLVTILEGIADKVSLGTSLNYRSGSLPFHENINPLNWAPQVAKTADAVIAVIGLSSDLEGEEVDAIASAHKGDRMDLRLPQTQIDYVRELAENKKGPLILVIASGSPVALHELYDLADAILLAWYPGEQGGNAVADILFGDASPSGHLPVTFPRSVDQLPDYTDYNMKGRTYKYMEEEPLFPFGFGLSYTHFTYTDLTLSKKRLKKGDEVTISVNVKNTGKVDSDEVVQLYLVPQNKDSGLARFNLKKFQRINLSSGESKTVSFDLHSSDLLQVNNSGAKAWIKGNYTIAIGNALPSQRSFDLGAAQPVSAKIEFK